MFAISKTNLIGLTIIALLMASPCVATVHVSEVMADNDNTLLDIDGDSSDWIELYNDSSNGVDLAGWYLSGSTTNMTTAMAMT